MKARTGIRKANFVTTVVMSMQRWHRPEVQPLADGRRRQAGPQPRPVLAQPQPAGGTPVPSPRCSLRPPPTCHTKVDGRKGRRTQPPSIGRIGLRGRPRGRARRRRLRRRQRRQPAEQRQRRRSADDPQALHSGRAQQAAGRLPLRRRISSAVSCLGGGGGGGGAARTAAAAAHPCQALGARALRPPPPAPPPPRQSCSWAGRSTSLAYFI
jgi:hypothetical protein